MAQAVVLTAAFGEAPSAAWAAAPPAARCAGVHCAAAAAPAAVICVAVGTMVAVTASAVSSVVAKRAKKLKALGLDLPDDPGFSCTATLNCELIQRSLHFQNVCMAGTDLSCQCVVEAHLQIQGWLRTHVQFADYQRASPSKASSGTT